MSRKASRIRTRVETRHFFVSAFVDICSLSSTHFCCCCKLSTISGKIRVFRDWLLTISIVRTFPDQHRYSTICPLNKNSAVMSALCRHLYGKVRWLNVTKSPEPETRHFFVVSGFLSTHICVWQIVNNKKSGRNSCCSGWLVVKDFELCKHFISIDYIIGRRTFNCAIRHI